MKNAIGQARQDIRQAAEEVTKVDKKTGKVVKLAKVVANCHIKDRVAHPSKYDRDGKLRKRYKKRQSTSLE